MSTSDRSPSVVDLLADLPEDLSIEALPRMDPPRGVLLCEPTYFDVVDVKNPFMEGRAGTVDRARALVQWRAMRDAFAGAGLAVAEVAPLPACEDMVFCANSGLLGTDRSGAKICAPSRMTFPSREPEVAATVAWCKSSGYRIADLGDEHLRFEGGGDAIWHPGRRLLWGGYGFRTDRAIYPAVAEAFATTVIAIELRDPRYYHLDTCFCPLDEKAVLVYPAAIADEGMRLIRRLFSKTIESDETDASAFACNAVAIAGGPVIVDRRAAGTISRLREEGRPVIEVDTGEFLKSGGSVYCMKNAFY